MRASQPSRIAHSARHTLGFIAHTPVNTSAVRFTHIPELNFASLAAHTWRGVLALSIFRGVRTVLSKAELRQRLQEVGNAIMARLKEDPLTT